MAMMFVSELNLCNMLAFAYLASPTANTTALSDFVLFLCITEALNASQCCLSYPIS